MSDESDKRDQRAASPPLPGPACSGLDREYLKEEERAVEAKLPDSHGFILLVAPYLSGGDQRLIYISSMRREDAIEVLKEWLIKANGPEEWMRHIE
jgi:hypothetical protein